MDSSAYWFAREFERETVPSAEPHDTERLTGTAGSSKEAKQEKKEGKMREKKGSHERVERERRGRSCLSLRSSWTSYIGNSVSRYKIDLVNCDTSAVSKFKMKIRVTLLYSSGAARM